MTRVPRQSPQSWSSGETDWRPEGDAGAGRRGSGGSGGQRETRVRIVAGAAGAAAPWRPRWTPRPDGAGSGPPAGAGSPGRAAGSRLVGGGGDPRARRSTRQEVSLFSLVAPSTDYARLPPPPRRGQSASRSPPTQCGFSPGYTTDSQHNLPRSSGCSVARTSRHIPTPTKTLIIGGTGRGL